LSQIAVATVVAPKKKSLPKENVVKRQPYERNVSPLASRYDILSGMKLGTGEPKVEFFFTHEFVSKEVKKDKKGNEIAEVTTVTVTTEVVHARYDAFRRMMTKLNITQGEAEKHGCTFHHQADNIGVKMMVDLEKFVQLPQEKLEGLYLRFKATKGGKYFPQHQEGASGTNVVSIDAKR
jgi:hypothetical protein